MNHGSLARWTRRGVGVVLLLVVVIPFWKLLELHTGPVASEAVVFGRYHAAIMVRNGVIALLLGTGVAWFIKPAMWERLVDRAANALEAPSSRLYAAALATVAGSITAGLAWYVWDNRPQFADVMAQLIHARYLAAGLWGGPTDVPIEFWTSTNTFISDGGWISQYPPGHVLLLAAGFRLGVFWIVNPLLMAATALLTSLAAERLLPDDRITARTGALLLALSPFLLTIAAAHQNHMTAAALASAAAYCSLRARDGSRVWSIAAGAAVGWMFGTRPLTAVTVGAVITGGVWLVGLTGRDRPMVFSSARLAGAFAGALPCILAVAAYNMHFFGSPFRFGYLAYLGPGHRFGFHLDPWGNVYDPSDALGYASADLLGLRVITAWALALVLPLALYWHHDIVLGPRLLSDAAPAWCLLAAVAGIGLVRRVPRQHFMLSGRVSVRTALGIALLGSVVTGLVFFTPQDLRQYAQRFANRVTPADVSGPALVFVHDTWNSRTAARLSANGMRADSVTIALTHNASCRLAEFADTPPERRGDRPRIVVSPGEGDGSQPTRLSNGVVVRIAPGEQLTPACLREARSDRFGAVPLMPLVWTGDLPGMDGQGVMYARDFGPETNARLLARFPNREPFVLAPERPGQPAVTMSFDEGMALLWGNDRGN
jgi:hypothetical protein